MFGWLLCGLGLHRWKFVDVRDNDLVVTWYWCRRKNCPAYHAPRAANVDHLPLPENPATSDDFFSSRV